jgi:hypothetical protein
MTKRLPDVLTSRDYSIAEMSALVLGGEVYWVDGCVSPIDVIPSPRQRAAALRSVLPPGLIAERMSAGWIWGALYQPPLRHQVCSDTTARARPTDATRLEVREVVITPAEVLSVDGLVVTTPLRTVLDIARTSGAQDEIVVDVIARLMRVGDFGFAECAAALAARRNLPHKKRALERLGGADAARDGLASVTYY